jgi:putative Ca2+/H+ antiporter (TMEM165/GDT1 family)
VNLVIAATVFPVIFLGELPDKTMFASLIMSTRGSPAAVWLGGAVAFAIHAAIAVSAGTAAVALLPRRALDAVVALLFLAGAALAIREMRRDGDADTAAAGEVNEGRAPARSPGHPSTVRVAGTAFTVIFIAEWGDLTQILTANMAARYHSAFSVGIGATLALWAVAGIAVASGQTLLRFINVTTIRKITAGVLVALALYSAFEAIR